MILHISSWQFRFDFQMTILAGLFICLFIKLGFWQLDRADYKRSLHNQYLLNQAMNVLDIQTDIDSKSFESIFWRKVALAGSFNENIQILLDNQVIKGQPGYFVYTPFRLHNNEWILVNRGWLPLGHDRKKLPPLIKTESEVMLNAVIKEVPRTGLLLKKSQPEQMADGVYRVNYIDLDEIGGLFSQTLLPFIARMQPENDSGYLRDWRLPGSGEEVHTAYAIQWFLFAATLFIIYLVLNTKKSSNHG